jgi:tungstate transport system ATP-binding protein
MTAPAPLLELQGLRVERGGAPVLDIPSFRIEDCELVSLIGPNGSGKTTLLLSILGLMPRAAGRVRWRGAEIASAAEALALRRRVALVQQDPLLFDTTVFDNVAAGLRMRGVGRAETRSTVTDCLDRFGLTGLADRAARKLSGGEARRVSLARAVAVRPDVLLLDEPFANLDAPTRQEVTADLERTIRGSGMAAILVTHDRSEALRLSDRMVVLHAGRIVQSASPSEVMNNPANEFIAACVGMDTIVAGTIERCADRQLVVAVPGARIEAVGSGPVDGRVFCCIRPENVTLEAEDPGGQTSARNVYRARVTAVTSMGPYLKIHLDCAFPLVSYVTPESFTALGLREGREVFASFKATSVHVIRAVERAEGAGVRRRP